MGVHRYENLNSTIYVDIIHEIEKNHYVDIMHTHINKTEKIMST